MPRTALATRASSPSARAAPCAVSTRTGDPGFGAALDEAYRLGRPWSSGAAVPVRWTHEDGTVRESRVSLIFQPVRDAAGAVVDPLHIGAEQAPEPNS